jgi:hypothetical protein
MATTDKGVPYPEPTDPNDVPADLAELAAWVDAHPGVSALTTAQRDALTGGELWEGRVILNVSEGLLQRYVSGDAVWRSGSVSDHGALGGLEGDDHPQYLTTERHDTTIRHGATVVDHGSIGGLGDDDHPQYLLRSLIDAKGDLFVGSAADIVARLAVGSNGQVLTADSAQAAGMKWAALPPYALITTGSYTGTGTQQRTVTLPLTPKMVWVAHQGTSGVNLGLSRLDGTAHSYYFVGAPTFETSNNRNIFHTTNGIIVGSSASQSFNESGRVYSYVAFG